MKRKLYNSLIEWKNFLVQTNHRIIPIEVKAEANLKSKSLSQFVTIDHADKNLKGLRCSMKPYIDQGWMENIPLYSILGYIKKQLDKEVVVREFRTTTQQGVLDNKENKEE